MDWVKFDITIQWNIMYHWKWCKTVIIDIQPCSLCAGIQNSIYSRISNCKNKKNICIYLYLESQEEELGLIFVFSVFSARNSEHVTTQCRIIICLCCLKFDSSKKAKRIDSLVGEEKEYGIFQREEWKDTESQVQMKS